MERRQTMPILANVLVVGKGEQLAILANVLVVGKGEQLAITATDLEVEGASCSIS